MKSRAAPIGTDVTEEVVSSGLGGKLARRSQEDKEWNAVPLDAMVFRMRQGARGQLELVMLECETEEETDETNEVALMLYKLHLAERTIGQNPLTDKETILLRAAANALPPSNRILRVWHDIRGALRQWNLRSEFAEKISPQILNRIVEEGRFFLEKALKSGRFDPEWHKAMGKHRNEEDAIYHEIVVPWAHKLDLTPEESEALRKRVLKKLGPFKHDAVLMFNDWHSA